MSGNNAIAKTCTPDSQWIAIKTKSNDNNKTYLFILGDMFFLAIATIKTIEMGKAQSRL